MTERETKPALTAAQWANVCIEGECRADDVWSMTRRWHPDPDDRPLGDDEPEPDYHAIAAVCLYGQPFGFTPEMLDALDTLMQHMDGPDDLALVRSMAAKIRALLPPA